MIRLVALLQAITAIIFWGVLLYPPMADRCFLRSLPKTLVPNFIWQKVAVLCNVYVRYLFVWIV